MPSEKLVIFGVLVGFALLEILFTNFFKKTGQTRDDAIVEIIATAMASSRVCPVFLKKL